MLPRPVKQITGVEFNPVKRDIKGKMPAEVVCNKDPLNMGRVRVRVIGIHPEGLEVYKYPWAYPCFPVASEKAVIWAIPDVGDWVWVSRLEDEDIWVWEGGWLTGGETQVNAFPNSILIYRNGQFIYLDDTHIRITNSAGASVILCENNVHIYGNLVVHGAIFGSVVPGTIPMRCNYSSDGTDCQYDIDETEGGIGGSGGGGSGGGGSGGGGTSGDVVHPSQRASCDNSVFGALSDEQMLCLTLYGEARGEPYEGKVAVAYVIKNRLKTGRWGNSIKKVVLSPFQFSCYNCDDPNRAVLEEIARNWDSYIQKNKKLQECCKVAKEVLSGAVSDPTGGALYYHGDPKYYARMWQKCGGVPCWAVDKPYVVIGNHWFYRG
jgi:hypothetical protein